jgi:hypothetical protein
MIVIFIDGITDKKLTFGQLKTIQVGFKRGNVLAIYSPNHVSMNNYP